MNKAILYIALLLTVTIPCTAQVLPPVGIHCPTKLAHGAGTFRLGIAVSNKSKWIDQCIIHTAGQQSTVKDSLLGKGEIAFTLCPLIDTEGFVVQLEGKQLPAGTKLYWAFGACTGKDSEAASTATPFSIAPEACCNNVFSDEGQAFTVYYGKVMALKVVQGIVPPNEGMRLADAHRQSSPLALYTSGKQTDAPVLTASCPLITGEKLYFCFYKQTDKADYNYFLLPSLLSNPKP